MSQQRLDERGGLVPATRGVEALDRPEMREWAEQLVARARAEGVELALGLVVR